MKRRFSTGNLKEWVKSLKPSKKSLKRFGYLAIFVAVFAGSLPLLDYSHHTTMQSDLGGLILLIIFFILVGLVFLAAYSLWLKTSSQQLLATVLATYVLGVQWKFIVDHSEWARSVLGSTKFAVLAQILLFVTLGLIAKLLDKLEPKLSKKTLDKKPLESIIKTFCVVVMVLNVIAFQPISLPAARLLFISPPCLTCKLRIKRPTSPRGTSTISFLTDTPVPNRLKIISATITNRNWVGWLARALASAAVLIRTTSLRHHRLLLRF
jgi:hypothetical protein